MDFKKIIIILAILLIVGCLIWSSQVSAQRLSVNLLTSSFGTTSYIEGTAIEDISKKFYQGLIVTQQETPGLVYNVKKLSKATPQEKKETIVVAADAVIWLAQTGKDPFDEKMGQDIVVLCGKPGPATYLMTMNPNIKSIKDLEGKSVAIGTKAMQSWGQFVNYYLEVGWSLKGKVKVQWIGLKPALTAFKDGLVDAMVSGAYVNPITFDVVMDPQTMELLSLGKRLYFLSPGIQALDKIRKEVGLPSKYITIPTGSIKGQDMPIETHISLDVWAASKELPEQIAYHFTKMMIENCKRLKEYHDLGKLVTPEALAYGWKPEDLHRGSYRAFKEAKLIK